MVIRTLTLFLFSISILSNAYGQATIGSDAIPNIGALLDLKQDPITTKGLGLPRVELQAYEKLQMGATAEDLTSSFADEHIGLVVYNIGQDKCDENVPTDGIYVWDGTKWVGLMEKPHYSPISLDLEAQLKQPNSYIVAAETETSVTIPIAKAFAVWNYWSSVVGGNRVPHRTFKGSLTVNIEWQEGMGQAGNTNNAILIDNPTLTEGATIADSLTAVITVNTTGELGNAVVSLSDDNGILWSWHIWVTTSPSYTINVGDYDYMVDRNLGATSKALGDNGSIGLYYQWGRPTPIPAYTSFAKTETTVPITTTPIDAAIADPSNDGGTNALVYAIKNPTHFITNDGSSYDWYSTKKSDWNTRWNEQEVDACGYTYDISSITNPCPSDWKLPVAINTTNTDADSPWSTLTVANAETWNYGYNWDTYPDHAGYYPAVGNIASASSLPVDMAISGNYWSGATNGIYAKGLYFVNGLVSPWIDYRRAFGLPIRCVMKDVPS